MLVKARRGFAARHIYRADDPDQLAFFLRYTTAESMVQAFCTGEEFSIDLISDLSGRCLEAVPRSMIESKGGETIKGESLDDAALRDVAVRVAETLGIKGPACVQCFRDGETHLVTDVNARFGGGFPVHVAAGGGYPDIVLALARGERPEPRVGSYRPGVIDAALSDAGDPRARRRRFAADRGRLHRPAHAARRLKLVYPQAVDAGGADDVEIALGVYVRRVVRRWWIVAAAIVVAIAIAVAGSSSGHTTYRAQTLISIGTPFTATGRRRHHERLLHLAGRPGDADQAGRDPRGGRAPGGAPAGRAQGPRLLAAGARAQSRSSTSPRGQHHRAGVVQGRHDGPGRQCPGRGVQAACSQYALRRLQTTQSRLDRELKEQADLSRRLDLAQTLLDKVQSDSGLSATNRLLAATVAGNTLSNIVQRQNRSDQFIGDDQSLLQQVKYVELTQIITRAKASKVTAGGSSASLGVAIVLGALIGIALALLSYVVFPARRSEA